jgi:hypothetical protein
MHPMLTPVKTEIDKNSQAPIYAALDRSANCPESKVWQYWNGIRQSRTLFNKNTTLYFNGGLIVTRICPLTRAMLLFVIDKTLEIGSASPLTEQSALWSFSNSSLYGILPQSLNCFPGGSCDTVCPPDVIGYHALRGKLLRRMQASFSWRFATMAGHQWLYAF